MCTARPGWQTMSLYVGSYKKTSFAVDVSMSDIISVDTERRVVRCQPLVTMGQISATLLPLGWTLPVVPELDDLTVGGLICGVGIETSSHKYGLFNETCVSFELVMADGSRVVCSREENPELFHAVPWSHGTLGFLVSAEIRIIPASKYVRLQYVPCHTSEEGRRRLEEASRDESNDFVEMLQFNREQSVLMIGHFADKPEKGRINAIGRWYKPWFFTHVQSYLYKNTRPEENIEYIPLRDYYHRHTRSIFWELKDIISFANHPVFRFLLGWAMPPKISLLKATTTGSIRELYEKHHIDQDMLVPVSKLGETLDCFHKICHIYPIWLCPFKITRPADPRIRPFLRISDHKDNLFIDVGTYGTTESPEYNGVEGLRKIEAFIRSVKGWQMLYANTMQTRDEFREMFDHSMYDELRKRYNCLDAFPEVYDKVSRATRTGKPVKKDKKNE